MLQECADSTLFKTNAQSIEALRIEPTRVWFDANNLPTLNQASQMINCLVDSWTTVDEGSLIYAHPELLEPQNWVNETSPIIKKLKDGKFFISGALNKKGEIVAMAALDGIEVGRIASSHKKDKNSAILALEPILEKVKSLNPPIAFFDIAANRTSMEHLLLNLSEQMDIAVVPIYADPNVYGNEKTNWGCWGAMVVDKNFLRNKGRVKVPINGENKNIDKLIKVIISGSENELEIEEALEKPKDLVPNSYTGKNLIRVDYFNTGEINRLMTLGFKPTGIEPTIFNGELRWTIHFTDLKFGAVKQESSRRMISGHSNMYTQHLPFLQLYQAVV